jgi:hypothetical protein
MLVILVFLRHHRSKNETLCYPTVIYRCVDMMPLFSIVHILQLGIFESILAYENVDPPFKFEHGFHLGRKKY